MLEKLVINHGSQTCRLRTPPESPVGRGKRSRLSVEEVRHARYLYWTGRRAALWYARYWDMAPSHVFAIMNFVRVPWM